MRTRTSKLLPVCAGLLSLMGSARAQGLELGPERFIASPDIANGEARSPGVGSSGELALVAWVHRPNNLLAGLTPVGPTDGTTIVAARVSTNGQLLDRFARPVATLPQRIDSVPVVGSDGSGFLVAWSAPNGDLRAVRVASDGTVQDPAPIVIDGTEAHAGGHDVDALAVAGAAGQYLMVWSSPSGVLYARITADGAVLDSPPVKLADANLAALPRVAATATQYLVTWRAEASLRAARIDRNGVALDVGGVVVSSGEAVRPSVTSNGSDFFVVWNEGRTDVVQGDVYGSRVTAAGSVTDATGIPIATGASTQWNPQVAATGAGYFVIWEERLSPGTEPTSLKGLRLGAQGTVLGPEITLQAKPYGQKASTVALGSNFLALWGISEIVGARIDPAGNVLDDPSLQLSLGRADELYQRVASNGSTYLVLDDWSGTAARLDARGTVLGQTGRIVKSDAPSPWVRFESSGEDFLAVWVQQSGAGRDFLVNRVRANGEHGVAGQTSIHSETGSSLNVPQLDLASSKQGYVVVWCDQDTQNPHVRALQLEADGVPAPGGPQVIARLDGHGCAHLSAASNPDGYLVVFSDVAQDDDTKRLLRGVRLGHDGSLLDPTPFAIAPVPLFGNTLAASGARGEWLVAWRSDEPVSGGTQRAVRVRSDGSVPDAPMVLSAAAPNLTRPVIASDGEDHVVTWSDYQSESGHGVFAVRVANGASEPEPFTIATLPGYPDPFIHYTGTEISVASRRRGEFLVVYPRYVHETRSFQRVARRLDYDVTTPDAGIDGGEDGSAGAPGTDGGPNGTGGADPDGSAGAGGTPSSTGGAGRSRPGANAQGGCDCSTLGRERSPAAPAAWIAGLAVTVLSRRRRASRRAL